VIRRHDHGGAPTEPAPRQRVRRRSGQRAPVAPAALSPGPTVDQWIDRFLNHLAAERGLAPNSLAAYSRDLAALSDHLEQRGSGVAAVPQARDLVGFLDVLQRRGLSARTRARMLAAVRGLCAFLVREGVIAADPARDIHPPRLGQRLPRTLAASEVGQLLTDAGAEANTLLERDVAMIELLYATGVRVSELVSLKVSQVNL
jgi:integrase/recombinase XerD